MVGLANWYRRFVNNAAELFAPLTDLIVKDSKQKTVWTEEAEAAFQRLKELLVSSPILAMADYTLPFKVYTDASLVAGAGILTQVQDGKERVIAYHSVKFSKTQQNYSATEREYYICLAVLSSVEKFRPWIDGTQFTVITDHASLKWLQNLKEPKGKLARWAVRLQAFDIKFEHRPGTSKEMLAPDALSRAVDLIDIDPNLTTKDPWYNKIKNLAESGKSDFYKMENGYLYRRGKYNSYTGDRIWTLCIPSELTPAVLQEKHNDSCHMGFWKTLRSIQNMYYWRGMHAAIYEYVTKCGTCRVIKHTNEQTTVPIGEYRHPVRPGHVLYIDFVGPLPASKRRKHMNVITCIDGFTRYLFTKSIVHATAEQLVEFLEKDIFFKFGVPEIIYSDNGTQFKSKTYIQFLNKYGVAKEKTPNYHAQSNMVEASNKSVKTGLTAMLVERDLQHVDWADYLPLVTAKLNSTPLTSTGQSPHFSLYGRERTENGREHGIIRNANPEQVQDPHRMELIHESMANHSRTAFEANRQSYDRKAKVRKFIIGDQVYIKLNRLSNKANQYTAKLSPRRQQVTVLNKIGNDVYELADKSGKNIGKYHANDIMTI